MIAYMQLYVAADGFLGDGVIPEQLKPFYRELQEDERKNWYAGGIFD